jgi:hypothetical protein
MAASQAFWPDNFHGDGGFYFVLVPIFAAPFMIGLVVLFIIGLLSVSSPSKHRCG